MAADRAWKYGVGVVIVLSLLLAGCSRDEPAPQPAAPPEAKARTVGTLPRSALLLSEPLPLQRVEVPAEALSVWRLHVAQRPTLLLLSSDPMLAPLPAGEREQVRSLVLQGSRAELLRRGTLLGSEPLLLPNMTIAAALQAGLLGEVIWALPLRDSAGELSGEVFRQRLGESARLDSKALQQLRVEKHLVRGTVRGTPLLAAALDQLPPLKGPVIVHIDQSYFQERYKNEVATPLLGIVYDVLYQLRERRLPVLAVTFAYGNLEERIALDVRFLGEMLTYFIEHPERAKEPTPANWQRMADIFHLESLFEKEKMRDLALAMERDEPESAWVKFALYRAAAAKSAGDYALDYLAEAVKRDRVYAVEYLHLAQLAHDKRRPDAALQMLELAAAAFPDNPQIQLKLAQVANDLGNRDRALQLVGQLQKLPWSPVYYPQMPDYLQSFAAYLSTAPPAAPSKPPSAPSSQPAAPLPMGHPGRLPPGHP